MSSKSLHSTTRKPLSWKGKIEAMFDAALREDREAAIKGASLVERSLEHAIKAQIVRLRKAEHKALFEGSGPLATFSAKIWIGYALGLYGPKAKHDLETIKDIRNVFAHTAQHVTFINRRIVTRCKGMHFVQRRADKRRSARGSFLDATRVFALLLSMPTLTQNVARLKSQKTGGDLDE
jgi:hypothetical protein